MIKKLRMYLFNKAVMKERKEYREKYKEVYGKYPD